MSAAIIEISLLPSGIYLKKLTYLDRHSYFIGVRSCRYNPLSDGGVDYHRISEGEYDALRPLVTNVEQWEE